MIFGEVGVGLFAQAGWIPQEQELGAEHSGDASGHIRTAFMAANPEKSPCRQIQSSFKIPKRNLDLQVHGMELGP